MSRKSKFLDDKTVKFDEEATVPELGPPPQPATGAAPLAPHAAAARAARTSRVAGDGDTMDAPLEHPDTLTDAHLEIGTSSDELVIRFRDESDEALEKAEEEFDARQTAERSRRRSGQARTTVVAVKKLLPTPPDFIDDEKTKERK